MLTFTTLLRHGFVVLGLRQKNLKRTVHVSAEKVRAAAGRSVANRIGNLQLPNFGFFSLELTAESSFFLQLKFLRKKHVLISIGVENGWSHHTMMFSFSYSGRRSQLDSELDESQVTRTNVRLEVID